MKGKGIIITVVSVIALILAVVFGVQGCQNSAISREEVINQSVFGTDYYGTEPFV